MDHGQRPMFAISPSDVYVAAHYDWRLGWRLSVHLPAVDGRPATTNRYTALSTGELLDVVSSELERALIPPTPSL